MELVSARVVSVGEGMLELSHEGADLFRMRSGGDTMNTSVYLARLGVSTAYLTALGDDRFSRMLRDDWVGEGIDPALILICPDRLPGLYAIETDDAGERSFHYWRERSAFCALFECDGADAALDRAGQADLLYLSGITLSRFDMAGRRRLIELAHTVRRNGGRVAFDPNYRARGWNTSQDAVRAFAELGPSISIALPGIDDEESLHGTGTPDAALERWSKLGVGEVVLKLGPGGALVTHGGHRAFVAGDPDPRPRDTTGAGDAFNAAYLAARLSGLDPVAAASQGNRLAATVIRHPGAVIPIETMPAGNVCAGA